MGNIGSSAVKAVPRIVIMMMDSHRNVRRAAEIALEKINPDWQESEAVINTLPHLVQALSHGEKRSLAAAALGKIGAPAVKAVPYLIKALTDRKTEVCTAAAFALGNLGEVSKPAIPYLKKLLKHSDWKIRSTAMAALKWI